MNNPKISMLVSALFLSTPCLAVNSYATVENDEIVANDHSEQCGYFYQEILRQPLIVNQSAVTIDKNKVKDIETMRQFADEYVMNTDISDFPSYSELYEYEDEEQARQILIDNHGMTEDDVITVVRYLFHSYYLGEYVPKDDYKAIFYLKKLIDYYKQEAPEQASNVVMGTFDLMRMYAENNVSEDNPTWKEDNVNAIFNLLIQAGSIEAEALLLKEYMGSGEACQTSSLPRLTELAEQGSRIAIHKLADIHTRHRDIVISKSKAEDSSISAEPLSDEEVDALFYDEPDDKGKYWRQKAEEYPLAKYESGF